MPGSSSEAAALSAALVRGTLALTDPESPQHEGYVKARNAAAQQPQQQAQNAVQQPAARQEASAPADTPEQREDAAGMIEQAFSATRVEG